MECKCPSCTSSLIKKNGHIHNGKQNYRCLQCGRQFVQEPTQKIIDDKTKELIKRVLLERISLEGICRAFEVSMPWLLGFIDELIGQLPGDLNAEAVAEDDEIEVVVLEADELWSYVGSKDNPQWLWLVMHSKTRQILVMEVGSRSKQTAEKLFYKLPQPLKKKPNTILTSSLCTTKRSPLASTKLSGRNQVRLVILSDLIALSDSAAQDL